MKISIDIETYSDVDLTKSGVYKYAESPNFEILLFGYSVNDGPVQVVDLARGEKIPDDILQALSDENVTKWAFNAIRTAFVPREGYKFIIADFSAITIILTPIIPMTGSSRKRIKRCFLM